MTLNASGLTDIGHRRSHNEDAFFCDASAGLFIVADGMGGRIAGETASKAVITVLPAMLESIVRSADLLTPEVITPTLTGALCQLSQHLYEQAGNIPEIQGLGSTAAMVLIHDGTASVAYAGDSRVYLCRDEELIQITEDQTIAATLIRTGYLSPETPASHPLRHLLEEYIGKDGELHPGVRQRDVQAGDRWLLCSDGLTKGIDAQELREILLQSASPEETCHTLIDTAKDHDGTDNITVIVVDIVSP